MREEARGAGLAAVVAWRAVSDELSRDDKGHTVELSSVSDGWLCLVAERFREQGTMVIGN